MILRWIGQIQASVFDLILNYFKHKQMIKSVKPIVLKHGDIKVSFVYLLSESIAFNVLTCLHSLLTDYEL